MSVTFWIVKKHDEGYGSEIYPDGFDHRPVIDPEYPDYGALPPDNPWELNVANDNAVDLLQILNLASDPFEWSGEIDPTKLIPACEEALSVIHTLPEMDEGGVSRTTQGQKGCRFIKCGHLPGWYDNRLNKLLELAKIAQQKEAVICYA